jgi:hypothetical protein
VKSKKVYILGAGCSVNYGYPLAKDFLDALKQYQVWVVGYSFDPTDRKSIFELLRKNKASCNIIVQNLEAEKICNELKLRYSDLTPRLKPLSDIF